ncbi:ArsR/SmtB family transcription factor [Fuchsiella alkaliacetigena]|uniref:ArsR/SmtB family transcription factor n=1 Tax=Fuchsiella alkaliacetigena TaxID=957042 RepID=UPI00200B5642|nr:metalloregulator ArsR/SmtB family transcription factor [Fuchsiella alkaliacetigena]MCK8825998.1 metalloregulator ArsR/SmtB family transcription factor [Fuchsiella alkaliacetigena]
MSELINKLKSDLFKALGHPTRIGILELLKAEGELCVCDIYENLDLSQSNISQHLKILKEQNIVSSYKDGVKVIYSLKDEQICDVLTTVEKMLIKQINETKMALKKD